jgi:preprotein translocase subunit SecE
MAEKMGEQQESGRRRRFGAKGDTQQIVKAKERTGTVRRRNDEDEDEGNVLSRTGNVLVDYFDGVRSELGKVVWPTRDDVQRLTLIVIATLLICALVLGLISLGFTELFRVGLSQPLLLFVVIAVGVAGGYAFLRSLNRRAS